MFDKRTLRPWCYALVVVAAVAAPLILNPFMVNLAQEVAMLAIAGVGLNLLLGLSGQISLGQAGFFAVAAYVTALLAQRAGLPLLLTIPAAVAVSGLAGWLIGLVALRARTHYLAMVTLAFGFIVAIVAQRWIPVTGGSMGLTDLPQLNWGDVRNGPRNYLWTVAGLWLVVQIANDFVLQSHAGRTLRAVAGSEGLASTVGIDASSWRVGTFVASAMLAGLSGSLFTHQLGYVSSDAFTVDRSLTLLIVVVVGGLGHAYGPLLGAIFLVLLNQAIADLYEYAGYLFGALLLAVMVLFPHGLSTLFRWPWKPSHTAAGDLAQAVSGEPVARSMSVSASASPVLELAAVTKSYAGVKAVQEVSLTVRPATVHALIGPNGAGKSTLINVISGLYRPDAGVILFEGEDVTALMAHQRARKGLARTFQNLQLVDGLTVIENVMLALPSRCGAVTSFGRWLAGRPHESKERADALRMLERFGIGEYADALPTELSYGHRKLAELARALAQRPKLMLLDEPIAGINEEESVRIAQAIAQLRESGIAILLVEHDMPFVMSLADEITVLDYGRVIARGSPATVRRDPAVIEAYLGAEVAL